MESKIQSPPLSPLNGITDFLLSVWKRRLYTCTVQRAHVSEHVDTACVYRYHHSVSQYRRYRIFGVDVGPSLDGIQMIGNGLTNFCLIPRPPRPAFGACSKKDLSRDVGCCWRHVQSANVWVCSLPFTLLSLNSVFSFCSVCPVSPIATGSIVASYSTWCQQRHASCVKFSKPSPRFSYCKRQKLGLEAWEWGYITSFPR